LNSQMEQARTTLAAARRVAQNTPIQLQAARESEQQRANARYKASLGNIAEVAEVRVSWLKPKSSMLSHGSESWRALLAVSVATGDVQPFLNQAK
jgi:outer membrane protein